MNENDKSSDFEKNLHEERHSFIREMTDFLRHNKKYWLVPIILIVMLLGALVILGGTAAAPFIYTLF